MKLFLSRFILAISLTACASSLSPKAPSPAPHTQAHAHTQNHSSSDETYIATKDRLIRIGASLMRANAPACKATRTIITEYEEFEICTNKVALENSPVKNAHTNGATILATTALINALSDDELAFVIAHELAHSVASHDIENGSKPSLELEADYFATFLALRAGYNPRAGTGALRKLGALKQSATASHPAGQDRLDTIARGASKAESQKRAGQNIGPDEP